MDAGRSDSTFTGPIIESLLLILLRLLYLDIWAYDGQIKQFDKLLMELYRTREEKCARQLLPLLDELAELHIYFQLLRLDWRARLKEAQRRDYENILDLLPHKEITHIPSNVYTIQNQVLGLIQEALDMDGRKGSLDKKLETPGYFLLLGGAIPMQMPGKFSRELRRMAASTVGEVMSSEPHAITPDTPVEEIATLMVEQRYYTLPVQENGRIVGVVGMEDLLRRLAAEE